MPPNVAQFGEADLFRFWAVTDKPTSIPTLRADTTPAYLGSALKAGLEAAVPDAQKIQLAQQTIQNLTASVQTVKAQYDAAAAQAPNIAAWVNQNHAQVTDAHRQDLALAVIAGAALRRFRTPHPDMRLTALMLRFAELLKTAAGRQALSSARGRIALERIAAQVPVVLPAGIAVAAAQPPAAAAPAAAPAAPAAPAVVPPKKIEIFQALKEINRVRDGVDADTTYDSNVDTRRGLITRGLRKVFGSSATSVSPAAKPTTKVAQAGFSTGSLKTVTSLGVGADADVRTAKSRMVAALGSTSGKGRARKPSHVMIAGVALPRGLRNKLREWAADLIPGAPDSTLPVLQSGEMMVVRKQLIGYELSEFSATENVMASERREREHRMLVLTEEETRRLAVVERETEHHLQQTEREELQHEVERVTETELEAEGNVKVQGSYGPSVKFEAEASVAVRSSTQASVRSSSNFAREVTSRAVERVRTRQEEETRRLRRVETEERNSHIFDNTRSDVHRRGIYRWLNRIYKAQVYNVGFRHSVEFILPEPAANYLRLLEEGIPKGKELPPKPKEPSLSPASDEWLDQWGDMAQEYDVTIPAPPEATTTVTAHVASLPSADDDMFAHSEKLAIPKGYEAIRASVAISKSGSDEWWVSAWVGNRYFKKAHDGTNSAYENGANMDGQRGEMTFAVLSRFTRGVTVTAEVECVLTNEALLEWQAQAYDAVLQAYKSQLAAWNDKVAEMEEQARTASNERRGPNPAVVEKLVREEVQRAFLSMLLRKNLDGLDAFAVAQDAAWKYDWAKAGRVMPQIGFLQQAFEWRNMNIVFYPYFYGRGNGWAESIEVTSHADPVFAEFVAAGAARVQVPIRPEMSERVLRFIETRQWPDENGDGQFTQNNNGVAILTEMLEAMDHPDDAVPVGDPWEFTVPTTLVLLDDAGNIQFRDPLRIAANAAAGGNGFLQLGVNQTVVPPQPPAPVTVVQPTIMQPSTQPALSSPP